MALTYKPEVEGRGISKYQKKGFFDCLSILFAKFKELICTNLLFCLFLLPLVITSVIIAFIVFPDTNILNLSFKPQFVFQIMLIPLPFAFAGPAICGLTRITRDIGREEHVYIFKDFFATFKRCFCKSIIISFIEYLFYVAAFFAFMVYWGSWLFFAVAAITTLYFTLMQKYIYLMTISLNLSIRKMYKNALLLILASIKKSLMALLFIIISIVLLTLYIISSLWANFAFIFMIVLIVIVQFAIPDLFINYYCFRVILEKVVDPYYGKDLEKSAGKEIELDRKKEEKPDKYKEPENISERSNYIYENGKLVRREVAEQENVFNDDKDDKQV